MKAINFDHVNQTEYQPADLESLVFGPVQEVVTAAIAAGEATISSARFGLYLIYDDPLFGAPVDILHLGYNREVGLYVRDEPSEADLRTLKRRLEKWKMIAAMTNLGEAMGNKTDYLRPYIALLYPYLELALPKALRELPEDDTNKARTARLRILFEELTGIMALLPRIIDSEEFYTMSDQDHEA